MSATVQTTYSATHDASMPGVPTNSQEPEMMACTNANASADLSFGDAVQLNTATRNGVETLASGEVAGIVVRSAHFDYEQDLNTTGTGVKVGKTLLVAHRGTVWVAVTTNVTRGDRAYAVKAGGFRNSADSTNTVDITGKARFLSTSLAGGLAELQFDFVG